MIIKFLTQPIKNLLKTDYKEKPYKGRSLYDALNIKT